MKNNMPGAAGIPEIIKANEFEAFTAAEVAARVRLHINTVRLFFRQGRIPGAVRFGSDWRLPATALAKLIATGIPSARKATATGSRKGAQGI